MIEFYKAARDCAWKTLLECKITSLPVDLSAVAHHYGIRIASYSTCPLFQLFEPSAVSGDGFVAQVDDVIIVFVNDKCASRPRRRFTLGHEIGHARLHHRLDVIHTRSTEPRCQCRSARAASKRVCPRFVNARMRIACHRRHNRTGYHAVL